jgi:hypothetical protein
MLLIVCRRISVNGTKLPAWLATLRELSARRSANCGRPKERHRKSWRNLLNSIGRISAVWNVVNAMSPWRTSFDLLVL